MKWICLLLLAACSLLKSSHPLDQVSDSNKGYVFRDVSGKFYYSREIKKNKNNLVSRYQIFDQGGVQDRTLEKSVAVSEMGSIKTKKGRRNTLRPVTSQYTAWLEGKQYFVQMKTLVQKRSLEIIMRSPEAKWNGRREIPYPKGDLFCFFSQMPECLKLSGLLDRAILNPKRQFTFKVLWDSYPYHLEQYTNLPNQVFTDATVELDKDSKKDYRLSVEIGEQTLLYHFSKNREFTKMFWIAQGVQLVPPSEYQEAQDEL